MTTTAITPFPLLNSSEEFAGGQQSTVDMMIGVGLVKDSEAVFFQYTGEDANSAALMLPSGKPLTRLANVKLAGIDIAKDVGEFNSTKLNLYLESSQGQSHHADFRSQHHLVSVHCHWSDGSVQQL